VSTHRFHPDPKVPDDPDAVLWDACDRCSEHADKPWVGLSDLTLQRLWERQAEVGASQMTFTEQDAIAEIKATLLNARMLLEKVPNLVPPGPAAPSWSKRSAPWTW
jgi:hypothetical protein